MLSSACQYAIKACIYLSTKAVGYPLIGLKEIAEAIDSPPPYTAKILNTLVREKLLDSGRGPHGGFVLAKEPENIRIIQIIDAIEGKDRFRTCLLGEELCCGKSPCAIHEQFHPVREHLLKVFNNTLLSDLNRGQYDQIIEQEAELTV